MILWIRPFLLSMLAILLSAALARAQDPEKFSLSMFHFNVQYVAGGLQGFPSGEGGDPVFDLDDAQVQDRIITESFEPILDLFLAHPDWKVTLEMQAYMAEIMLERHPGVLSKLKTLADRGQAELVSFHWSDQLFLAYPRLDLERSHTIMDEVYREAGLDPSGVVFCQEGQFGVGMGPFAREHGRSILVLPKNLFKYQHQSAYETAAPLYDLDGIDIVLGAHGFANEEVIVNWSFFDDGEVLATSDATPYLGLNFEKSAEAVAAYEQELEDLQSQGYRIASITEFVEWAKENGLSRPKLPPILDGTWQPKSTNSMRLWLGGSGLVDFAYDCERDNQVVSGNTRARHWIEVAEVLVSHAEEVQRVESGSYTEALTACWREVLLAQVSDASGLNPFINEVNYGLDHAASASACANSVIAEVAASFPGPVLEINTGAGTVQELTDLPTEIAQPVEPLFSKMDGFEVIAAGRSLDVTWEELGADGGTYRLVVEASVPTDGSRSLEVVFPLDLDGFYLTPGLIENQASYHPFSEFDFQEGRISLPVANGLVGLGDDLWVIKQTNTVHLAATFMIGDGRVRFINQTMDPEAPATWVFWIVSGTEEKALALASRLNLHPVAYVETGNRPDRGCGCGPHGGTALWGLVLLAALLSRYRTSLFSSC